MAKICIVLHDLRGGGAEKMMVRLANQLAEDGDTISIILVTGGGQNIAFLNANVELIELNCLRTLTSFLALRGALQEQRPDAILCALTHINVITALSCLSLGWLKRLHVSERNAFSMDKLVNSNCIMKAAYRLAPWVYRFLPNPVICVSNGVAEDLVEHTVVREQDIVIAPNPVITNEVLLSSKELPTHEWLLKKDKPVIVAVGRLAYQKGFDLLLDVFSRVTKHVECRLVIFGEGEQRLVLETQIKSLGLQDLVSMPGYTLNPIAELNAADLYVLSSRFEGSPNALVEAMSVGIPVIAFDCPCGAREILLNGQMGSLVEYLNLEKMTQHVLKIVLEVPKRERLKERAFVLSRYSASESARCYRKLLLDIK